MNFRTILFLLIATILAIGCINENNKNSLKNNKNGETALVSGGCYNVSNEKITEFLNIVFDEKEINGTGKRTFLAFNETFDLNITGKKNKDGNFEVSIIARSTMEGRGNVNETSYETWKINDKTLDVISRNSSHFIGPLSFIKVNCEGSTKKDSSLFDAFLGFQEGYAAVIRNGKWGIVDKNWSLVVPCAYYELGNVSEGAVKYYNENTNKYGFLEVPENKVLVDAKYVHVTNFSEGYAAVLDDEKGRWGIINRKGEMVVEPKYWSVSFFPQNPYLNLFNEGFANVAIDDAKWGYIDTNLKTVIPFEYIFAEAFKDGMGRVNKNGKDWFYIDKTGKCVKDCK